MSETILPPQEATQRPEAPRPRGRLRAVALGLLGLIVVVGLFALSVFVLLHGERGSRWLLRVAPGVQAQGVQGAILGEFQAQRIVWRASSGVLTLEDLRWSAPVWYRSRAARWGWGLRWARMQAHVVDWRGAGKPATHAAPPTSLDLPVSLDVSALSIDRIEWGAGAAQWLGNVRAALDVQDMEGAVPVHRLRLDRMQWGAWLAHGRLQIGATGALAVQGRVLLAQGEGAAAGGAALDGCDAAQETPAASAQGAPVSQARIDAQGTLAQWDVQALARAKGQCLAAQARVTPFAAMPIERLHASARRFDLSQIDARLPGTAMSGEVWVAPVASVRPPAGGARGAPSDQWAVRADVVNDEPGAWPEHRLPLHQLQLRATVGADVWRQGNLDELQATLADEEGAGGRIQGHGRWEHGAGLATPPSAQLHLRLEGVRLSLWDARVPPWSVSGQVDAQGVPAPGARSGFPVDVSAQLQARAAGGLKVAATTSSPLAEIGLRARWQAGQLDVEQLQARSAQSMAQATGQLRWDASTVSVKGQGRLSRFDPGDWSPVFRQRLGTAGSRIEARVDVDLRGQRSAAQPASSPGAWTAGLSDVIGRVRCDLAPSTLAGQPLRGEAQLVAEAGQPLVLTGRLNLADNAATVDARLDRRSGPGDHWSWQLSAPRLDETAALLRLVGAAPLAGQLSGRGEVQGRWPQVRSQGRVQATALSSLPQVPSGQAGEASAASGWRLAQLSAQWQVDTASGGPWQVTVQAAQGMEAHGWGIESLQASLNGSAASHHWQIEARTLTPALRRRAASSSGNPGTAPAAVQGLLSWEGEGHWRGGDETGGGTWHAQVSRLQWRAEDAQPAGGAPWFEVQPFDVAVSRASQGWSLHGTPFRARVMGAAVSVDQLAWSQRAGEAPDIQLDVQLEPLAVAPLLARWQPQAGWGGDLVVGGHVRLHSGRRPQDFLADIEIARQGGDLTLTDSAVEGAAVLHLGISEMRLAAHAERGVWTLRQLMTGRVLGEVDGQQTLHCAVGSVWPGASSALEGQVLLRIANLRPWGTWAPAGWRLSGEMQAQARLSGTLGAPGYEGRVTGQDLGVSNLLQGVNLSGGELAVALNRSDARIERFVVRAAPGVLRISGGATFGAQPQAHLQVVAERFGLLQRVDRQAIVSGQADIDLSPESLGVKGHLSLDQGLVDIAQSEAPSLSDDVDVDTGQAGREVGARTGAQSLVRKVSVDLTLDLGSRTAPALVLTGRGIHAQLGGRLHLTNASEANAAGVVANRPRLNGFVNVVHGEYAAYGQQLDIARGTIHFNGPVDSPQLDILALRKASPTDDTSVKVGVSITGTAQEPRVRLYSEPDMSDTEKLSWLVLGHGSTGLGSTDLALLQSAASALLAGENSGSSVFQALGVDELSVRQDNTTPVHQTIVSVGKQISRRWYVGYERSLSATAGTWQLIYRWAQHFTVRAQSGMDNSVDLIWSLQWQ